MLYCGNTILTPLPPYGLTNNHITYRLLQLFDDTRYPLCHDDLWRLSRSGQRCDKPFDAGFSVNESAHDLDEGTSITMLRNFKS